jgi:hypothetical protein
MVAKSTWSAEAGYCLVVERVEIKKRTYGDAWGRHRPRQLYKLLISQRNFELLWRSGPISSP